MPTNNSEIKAAQEGDLIQSDDEGIILVCKRFQTYDVSHLDQLLSFISNNPSAECKNQLRYVLEQTDQYKCALVLCGEHVGLLDAGGIFFMDFWPK